MENVEIESLSRDEEYVKGLFESMTGFDEIAIERMFGKSADVMRNSGAETLLLRSLVFVAYRREGLKDPEAFKKVMNAPMKEINAFIEQRAAGDAPGEAQAENSSESGPPSPQG